MAFQIAAGVKTPAIGLLGKLTDDLSACCYGPGVVRVEILNNYVRRPRLSSVNVSRLRDQPANSSSRADPSMIMPLTRISEVNMSRPDELKKRPHG